MDSGDKTQQESPLKGKRIFLSKAYLSEVESGTFALFRNIIIEDVDESTGKLVQEKKGKPIGPIALFRKCEGEEKPDLRTIHPSSGTELLLKSISEV